MSDNVNIIVQDTINEIVVNTAVVVETIDINVQVAVDEVNIIANPNNYVVNINRIIGEQVQSDWDQNDDQEPDYIKNKPIIPAPVTKTSDLTNDGEDGINPFITANDVTPQVNSDWNATSGVAEILNKPTIPAAQVNSDWNATSGVAEILNKPIIPSIDGLTPNTRLISTTTPLQGGGDLSENRTLSILQSNTTQSGFLTSTDWNTFNGKFTLPSLTSGSVLFSNGTTIAQDNANLFWDDTNNRLGIGMTPTAKLTIKAPGALSTDIALRVRNSADTGDLMNVSGSGNSSFKTTNSNTNGTILFTNNSAATIAAVTDTASALTLLQFRSAGVHFTDLNTNGILIEESGNYGGLANASSITELKSSTKGFLPPRMTTTQRDAIATPASGLVVYDTTLNSLANYNGTSWVVNQPQLNGTGFIKASGTTISYDNSVYSRIILNDFVNDGITGTTVNTIIRSYLIPSNTFVANNSLDILCSVFKNTTANNVTFRVYLNTSVSLTGATLLGTYALTSTTKFVNFQRTHIVAGSSLLYGFPPTVSNITDRAVTNIEIGLMPFNILVDNYIIFAIQLSNSLDGGYISGIKVSK